MTPSVVNKSKGLYATALWYQALYAGNDNNPYTFENDTGQVEEVSWHEHGRTVEMIEHVCRKRSVPLHTIWNNCLIMSFRPPIYDRHVKSCALCVKGNHAYFYEEANTREFIANNTAENTRDSQSRDDCHRRRA